MWEFMFILDFDKIKKLLLVLLNYMIVGFEYVLINFIIINYNFEVYLSFSWFLSKWYDFNSCLNLILVVWILFGFWFGWYLKVFDWKVVLILVLEYGWGWVVLSFSMVKWYVSFVCLRSL